VDEAKNADDSRKEESCDDSPSKEDSSSSSRKKRSSRKPPPTAILNESGRSTRSSINPDFAAKQRSFLNKVQNAYSSIKLLEAASSMSESEGDEDLSDSSYSEQEESRPGKSASSAEKKTPEKPTEKRVVALPPGLAEKLAEKSRALLTDKRNSVPFTIGDKRLAPLATDKSIVTIPVNVGDKKATLSSRLLANGITRKSTDTPPIITTFRGAKVVHELDEEQTLLVPASSRADGARKRKASTSLEVCIVNGTFL